MSRDYKKIIAWERGHELTLSVYRETKSFPAEERFGLISQLRRAAYGLPSNIAEGSGRDSKRDYLRFLFIAAGSLRETEYFLLLARDLGYINAPQFAECTEQVNASFAALHGLINAVRKEVEFLGRSWALIVSVAILQLTRITPSFA
jgi:four helix bundle protein